MEEGVVEVGAFIWRHATIFSLFAVEDEVESDDTPTDHGGAVQETLTECAARGRVGNALKR